MGAGLWRKLRKGSWQLLLGTVHPRSGEVVLAVLQGFKLLFYWMLQAGAAPPERSRSSALLPRGLLARSCVWTRAALAAPPAACKPSSVWVGEGRSRVRRSHPQSLGMLLPGYESAESVQPVCGTRGSAGSGVSLDPHTSSSQGNVASLPLFPRDPQTNLLCSSASSPFLHFYLICILLTTCFWLEE